MNIRYNTSILEYNDLIYNKDIYPDSSDTYMFLKAKTIFIWMENMISLCTECYYEE